MKPAAFRYERPDSVAATLAVLAREGDDAKLLAGGQSLIPILNMRLARPAVLVDLGRVPELRGIRRSADRLHIRSMTTQAQLERTPELPPALAMAVRHIAHPQIRARGTVGGSLAHMDPLAEWPAVALALDATLMLESNRGTRLVAAKEFIVAPLTTCLRSDELLVEIQLPIRPGPQAFAEVARRPGDFALAGSVLSWPAGARPSIAVFGMGTVQTRLTQVEAALAEGFRPGPELRALAYGEITATSDVHATAEYRRRTAAHLVERLVEQTCKSR